MAHNSVDLMRTDTHTSGFGFPKFPRGAPARARRFPHPLKQQLDQCFVISLLLLLLPFVITLRRRLLFLHLSDIALGSCTSRDLGDGRALGQRYWLFRFQLWSIIIHWTLIAGYGFYTPTTLLARSLTTAYSLLGIPLFLLYLSVVGERLARVINRMACSCCCCCDGQREEGRPGRRRIGAYRQYSDVTLALQPMAYHAESNGHVSQLELTGTPQPTLKNGAMSACCSTHDTTAQVPLLVCAGLLAVFIGLASLLLVLFEPQLGFVDSLHLTINLLMTLGFAGNLLPGMSAEGAALDGKDGRQGVGSQLSLLLVACLILLGTTLLSSSFNVLMDSINSGKSTGPPSGTSRSATTYHHMPSPSRQLSWLSSQFMILLIWWRITLYIYLYIYLN